MSTAVPVKAFAAGDWRGDTVADTGGDAEAGVLKSAGREREPREQRIEVGDRAAKVPTRRCRRHRSRSRPRGGGVEAAGARHRQRQRGGDGRAVDVADDDVGQVQRRVFGVGPGSAGVGGLRQLSTLATVNMKSDVALAPAPSVAVTRRLIVPTSSLSGVPRTGA